MTQAAVETSQGLETDLHLGVLWAVCRERVPQLASSSECFEVVISLVGESATSGALFIADADDPVRTLDRAVRKMLKHFHLPVEQCPAIEKVTLSDVNGEGRRVFIMTARSHGFSQKTFEGTGKTEFRAAMAAMQKMYAFFLQGLSITFPV